jgi:hypothetical protein
MHIQEQIVKKAKVKETQLAEHNGHGDKKPVDFSGAKIDIIIIPKKQLKSILNDGCNRQSNHSFINSEPMQSLVKKLSIQHSIRQSNNTFHNTDDNNGNFSKKHRNLQFL